MTIVVRPLSLGFSLKVGRTLWPCGGGEGTQLSVSVDLGADPALHS